MDTKIKVLVADGQPLFRRGVCSSLSQLADVEVLEESEVNERVLATIEASPPDVVLVDIDTPSLGGLELCRRIKRTLPRVAIVLLSSHPEDKQLFEAIKSQASAYLGKQTGADELVQVIRRCAQGEHPINESFVNRPRVAEQILHQFQELSRERETADFISPLTPKETEILDYMAQGYLNKQIADVLSVSEQTIKNHISSILRKLNVNARTQAVVVAIKKGLVSISKE